MDNAQEPKGRVEECKPAEDREEILRFFEYDHLPPGLRNVSALFAILAHSLVASLPRCAERSVALRKLLEAKDAAVRARVGW